MGLARLELATSPLSGVRSNHLSYRPIGLSALRTTSVSKTARSRALKTESDTIWYVGLDRAVPLSRALLLRKEVIQPQVPLRLPCYDFTPVINHSLGTCLPCGLAQPLLEQSTPMV